MCGCVCIAAHAHGYNKFYNVVFFVRAKATHFNELKRYVCASVRERMLLCVRCVCVRALMCEHDDRLGASLDMFVE